MWGWGPGPGGWIVAGLVVLAVAVGLAVLVAVATGPGRGGWAPPGEDAAAVLAERFARGEIDEQEYRRRLAVLEEGPGAAG